MDFYVDNILLNDFYKRNQMDSLNHFMLLLDEVRALLILTLGLQVNYNFLHDTYFDWFELSYLFRGIWRLHFYYDFVDVSNLQGIYRTI